MAQRRFDRGMRYQHSFWYRASKDIFEDVLKADPDCAIAYWGIGMSLLLNPFGVPPAGQSGGRARGHSKGQSHRRKDAARTGVYRRARRVLYRLRQDPIIAAACRPISRPWRRWPQHYPQDDEAQIYYAIALNVAASPADKTYANQLKAAAILETSSSASRNIPASRTI